MVKESGGEVAKDYAGVGCCNRRYKQFKPQGIAELNEGGQQLAQRAGQEIAQDVDALTPGPFSQRPAVRRFADTGGRGENEGGQHG